MNKGKVSIDGEIVDGKDATVSIFDRGFLYGDSVFEVFRTYGGRPFAERPHLERLQRSAERLMIPMPVDIDTLSKEVAALMEATDHGDSYLRVVITRGQGPLTYDPTTATKPLRVIMAIPVTVPAAERYERGINVAIMTASRPTDDPRAAGAKASNYLANLLVMHEAKTRGAEEAILLGSKGQLLEGASSNIFVVKNGKISTPTVEPGILVGITRAFVLQLAAEQGIEAKEAALMPDDLRSADEAFITSSIREVMPVVAVDGAPIGSGKPGVITRKLMDAYRSEVARQIG